MEKVKKVFVSGCFDLLHSGHIAFFEEASQLGDLYVGLGADKTIFNLKNRRTVYSEKERLYMIQSLKFVKDAWVNSGSGTLDFEEDIKRLKPDILFVNEDGAKDGIDRLVETFVIGAMNTSSALKHLRQVKSAVVITGGDRVDLAIAALNEDPSCLILTGFIQPDISIVSAANEKGIPVILSPSDTYTTIKNIERIE